MTKPTYPIIHGAKLRVKTGDPKIILFPSEIKEHGRELATLDEVKKHLVLTSGPLEQGETLDERVRRLFETTESRFYIDEKTGRGAYMKDGVVVWTKKRVVKIFR